MNLYRWEITQRVLAQKVFAIIRKDTADEARAAAEAVLAGGLRSLEITLTVPGALGVIGELRRDHPDALVGAGTVLDAAAAYAAIDAGAQFLVAPSLAPDVVSTAHRYGLPAIPGVGTATEVVTALEAGADAIKAFPASALGPAWVREVRGPLPAAPLIPTGGVRIEDVPAFLAAGAVACGLGSGLTKGTPADVKARIADLLAAAGD